MSSKCGDWVRDVVGRLSPDQVHTCRYPYPSVWNGSGPGGSTTVESPGGRRGFTGGPTPLQRLSVTSGYKDCLRV